MVRVELREQLRIDTDTLLQVGEPDLTKEDLLQESFLTADIRGSYAVRVQTRLSGTLPSFLQSKIEEAIQNLRNRLRSRNTLPIMIRIVNNSTRDANTTLSYLIQFRVKIEGTFSGNTFIARTTGLRNSINLNQELFFNDIDLIEDEVSEEIQSGDITPFTVSAEASLRSIMKERREEITLTPEEELLILKRRKQRLTLAEEERAFILEQRKKKKPVVREEPAPEPEPLPPKRRGFLGRVVDFFRNLFS